MKHRGAQLGGLLCILVLGIMSCTRDQPSTTNEKAILDSKLGILKQAIVQTYADLVYQSYLRAYQGAQGLEKAVEALVIEPSEVTLTAARMAWLSARVPYGETEAFRFYGGPIDDEDGPEGRLNAWPMDESYVDYVVDQPSVGIINRPEQFPVLNRETLIALNERDGEANICTGYHTIEFLLWGQDLSDQGPGTRPASDYFVEGSDQTKPAFRRSRLLVILTELLVADLGQLVTEWAPNSGENYRAGFVADPRALEHILTGIGSLSGTELAGERMAVALATRAREEEQSCFSDNTKQDHIANAQSVLNVYLGKYPDQKGEWVEGKGLFDLFTLLDPVLANRGLVEMELSIQACRDLPDPFERALVEADGRKKLQFVINQLRAQTKTIVAMGDRLDIRLNLEE